MAEIKLALLGYDTDVGKALIESMEDEGIELADYIPLSYTAEDYDAISYRGKNYQIRRVDDFEPETATVLLIAGNYSEADRLVAQARKNGLVVVDAGEVNVNDGRLFVDGLADADTDFVYDADYIVPMSSEATMLSLILKPVSERADISSVSAVMMESVSGVGDSGTAELARESISLFNMRDIAPRIFPSQMAFNVHTAVGDINYDDTTTHENNVIAELKQVLGETADVINLTSMVVPVFYGHTLSLNISFREDISLDEFKELIAAAPGVEIVDDEEITPVKFGKKEDKLYISRIRALKGQNSSFTLVAVMDNFLRGVVLNCLGIIRKLSLK
ncbi:MULTISPECIES: Asd/ArgC dimerization domain-containing protein [Ruminobacter]|uniref:Aspartate-semialdehyde dehydrogenase n=1 Tax=Ruminobacter amylophilus TaxID=867 RepID=A0A662ZDY7_9GAMM|nr:MULTISPECIES: Asd/ArgC dimerization domain-containing protein [Ruminobacter]SFO98167.1 Aspartate-semialdehyde dehydrogenase [Ruminobacter amylophilus]